jgi:hypothetical protein
VTWAFAGRSMVGSVLLSGASENHLGRPVHEPTRLGVGLEERRQVTVLNRMKPWPFVAADPGVRVRQRMTASLNRHLKRGSAKHQT